MHEDFRPFARDLSGAAIAGLALFSASGEELLFRGLGQPYLGLIPQALIFGVLHQMPGPSRWVWASWALLVGLGLGIIFQLTGSLLGPLLAHAIVNGLNLTYLKHHDPKREQPALGGLLGSAKLSNLR
jgi:membrane protease YdiL (CAAX protease family)